MTTITTEPNGNVPDIIARLEAACVGHPHARIPWPHRLLHDAIAEITALRHLSEQRENAEAIVEGVIASVCSDGNSDAKAVARQVVSALRLPAPPGGEK